MKAVWVCLVGLLLLAGPAAAQVLRPPALNAQLHRAETAWRSGTSLLEAKARVDRVLEALPDDVEARKLRARVLLDMDRPTDAFSDAYRAAQLAPSDGEAYLILCETARRTGDLRTAQMALEQAATHAAEEADVHVRLSWNAVALEDLEKAEAYARIALALGDREPAAYYQLARVFTLRDQTEDAVTVLVRGFEASLLEPALVRQDDVLRTLIEAEALRPFLKP